MRRTITWEPEQIHGDNVVKQVARNGHENVSGGAGGPVVSTFLNSGVGTDCVRKPDTKVSGPDSGLSWVVAVVSFVVSMISASYSRCLGFFFTAFMSTFDVSRAEASLPLAVYIGFMFMSGLFAAILIPAYGTRMSTIIGGTCLTVGLSVSFFANGVTVLIFTAGFLSGSGHGIIINSGVVCVSQYFDKRRGVALGLNMAGATIASLVFPKLYEYLLAEYGLHGTFLIIGASMGNVVPLAMVMKAPPWKVAALKGNTTDSDATDNCQRTYDAPVAGAVYEGPDKLCLEMQRKLQSRKPAPTSQVHCVESICRKGTATSLNEVSSVTESRIGSIANMTGNAKMVSRRSTLLPCHLSTICRRGTFTSCGGESSASQAEAPDLNELRARRGTMLSVAGSMYASNKTSRRSIAANAGLSRRATVTSISKSQGLNASARCCDSMSHELPTNQEQVPSSTSVLQNTLQVLKNPRFYFHALSYVSWGFFIDCFLSVVFDFAQDAGVARADTVHALTSFSATDSVGRLFVPCLSDYNLISNCGLLTIAYLMLSLLQQVAPYVRGKECVWALTAAFGLPAGYIMVGASQILSTEIDSKNLPIAYGLMNTATAMGCFVRPLLIGYFRDNYGSYDGLFRFIGGMLAISFLFSLGLWITDRCKKRNAVNAIPDASVSIPEPTTTMKEEHTCM
ncbi:uncharacterized protein LOC119390533 isoform X2 [Rhipicephalus sanguineus]|uniref:Monocarboxylate transporter n=1 Tax=Rhipicephalus sanguineus TaxID=34632 RepID=A0A9D4PUS0_RHISA|nr:uncharacterized protein LOC119390533 isoform X2 [Rhipicephalus sanguineus]KAH7955457.1 hypothetical protein HPB52_000907 [Rhipicephalus sanguineus]